MAAAPEQHTLPAAPHHEDALAVEPVYVLVDTAIVGRLGTPQLAGMAIASIVLLNVISLLVFLEYVTPDIAYAVSAGRPDDARRTAAHGVWLSCFIGFPAAIVLALAARPLCWLIGGRGEVLHHATTYLSISALGLPFVLLAFLGHGVLRGYNDLRTPLTRLSRGRMAAPTMSGPARAPRPTSSMPTTTSWPAACRRPSTPAPPRSSAMKATAARSARSN